jgi:hypothetical protein
MRRRHLRLRWPRVTHNGPAVPGDVKLLSAEQLSRLTASSAHSGWSARGRPAWLANNADGLECVYLTAFAVESNQVFRCMVTPVHRDGTMGVFTLDVSFDDFKSLRTISVRESVELLHLLLAKAPVIPLDPDQQERAR